MTSSDSSAPDQPRTAGELVRAGACDAEPGRMVFHLADGARECSAGELYAAALERGAALVARGLRPGDPVGVAGPNDPAWVEWAFGTWVAGGALVPLPVPIRLRDPSAYAAQLHALTSSLGCRFTVAHPRYAGAVDPRLLVPWDERDHVGLREPVAVDVGEPAVIACTSGSTALPKGVVYSHAAAVSLLVRLGPRLAGGSPSLRQLWWTPFFHALGLGKVTDVLQGAEVHVLPPEQFARDPGRWLRLVGEIEAHVTGGPSSGWTAALRAIARRPGGVDLSSLVVAMVGLEMVDPDVIEQLVTTGGTHGLRPEAVMTSYGMTETGGGTVTPFGETVRIDEVDLETLVTQRRAVAPRPGRPSKRVASCGAPMPGMGFELRVTGPAGAAGDRVVGEVQFRDPAMDRYLDDRGEDPFDDGWFRTGDLGYLVDGELYVTGRSKEMVVHHGGNYYPQDIEWAVEHRLGIEPGTCVAFAPTGGTEGDVVVALELPTDDDEPGDVDGAATAARARQAVVDVVGLVPREVMVLPAGALPKAANGKLQRLAARDAHARGELHAR